MQEKHTKLSHHPDNMSDTFAIVRQNLLRSIGLCGCYHIILQGDREMANFECRLCAQGQQEAKEAG